MDLDQLSPITETPVEKETEPLAAIEDVADSQNEGETQIEEAEIENEAEVQIETETEIEEAETEDPEINDGSDNEQENAEDDAIDLGLNADDMMMMSDVEDVAKRYIIERFFIAKKKYELKCIFIVIVSNFICWVFQSNTFEKK